MDFTAQETLVGFDEYLSALGVQGFWVKVRIDLSHVFDCSSDVASSRYFAIYYSGCLERHVVLGPDVLFQILLKLRYFLLSLLILLVGVALLDLVPHCFGNQLLLEPFLLLLGFNLGLNQS